jgi:predicted nucleic acid-binding protein
MIILDTNVLSELLRPAPAGQVERWLSAQDGAKVYFTTVGEAELRLGVAILPAGKRRATLTTAIEGLLDEDFRDRILPFDRPAARAYATIAAERRAAGRPMERPASPQSFATNAKAQMSCTGISYHIIQNHIMSYTGISEYKHIISYHKQIISHHKHVISYHK